MKAFFEKNKDKKTLLLTHHNADADALASVLLLGRVLKKLGYEKLTYGVADDISLQARGLLEYADQEVVNAPDPAGYEMVIVLDTSTPNQLGNIDVSKSNLVVVDHHEKSDAFSGKFFVDPKAYSTTQHIRDSIDVEYDKTMATLLLLGLIADSAYLKYAGRETFKAVADLLLKHKLEYGELTDVLSAEASISERIAGIKGCQRAQLHRVGDYLIVTSRVGSFEAAVARALLRVGADVAFVGCDADEARISARAKGTLINETGLNLGKSIMPSAGRHIGGNGSGHAAAAGANGPHVDKLDEALSLCVSLVKKEIEQAKPDREDKTGKIEPTKQAEGNKPERIEPGKAKGAEK